MLHIILLGTKIKKSHNLVKGMRLSNIRCPGYRVTCTASLLFLGFQFQLDRLINNQIRRYHSLFMVEVLYPTRISTHGGSIDGSKFIPTQKHTKWCVLDSEISILHASSPTHFVDHWRIILHISLQRSVAADEDKWWWCLCADAGIPTYMLECFSIASNICMACFIHVFSVLSGEYWWKYEKKLVEYTTVHKSWWPL